MRALAHYAQYKLALHLARRCEYAGGMMHLRVLDAQNVAPINSEDLHDPAPPEVDPDDEGRYGYQVTDGHPVCFSVENRSSRTLTTHTIHCASSGKVKIWGLTQLEVSSRRRREESL